MDLHKEHNPINNTPFSTRRVPTSPSFDFDSLLRLAIEQEYTLEREGLSRPPSPIPYVDNVVPFSTPCFSDDELSLSSVPPSPTLPAAPRPNAVPSVFLHNDDNMAKIPKKPQEKKNPAKKKTPRRQKRQTEAGNTSRKKRRAEKKNSVDAHHESRQSARLKHLGSAEAFFCHKEISSPPVAKGAYVALNSENGSRKTYKLNDLVGENSKHKFHLQEWDGSHSVGIVDKNGRVVVILAGHPNDKDWPKLQTEAAEALESRRARCSVPKEARHHRRGKFITLNCGVSFGGGQQVPSNLQQSNQENEEVLTELNSLEPFKRVAGFSSSVMATWAPKMHAHYQDYSLAIHSKYPHLKRIFPACIFSAASYNLGPQTVCYPHNDKGNLPSGMCAVTPFGPYDYKKGGHLVLWELKLVVEFPPGCTILLPSAILTHFNIPIAKNERHYSFAQYTAGGLFRWVDQGFQTKEAYRASLTPEGLEAEDEMLAKRWEKGLSLIPTVSNQ